MQKNKLVRSMGTPTISKSILKLSTLTLSMMCLSLAHAEETESSVSAEPTKKVAKVTVTGSSIKGVAAQSSSPITVMARGARSPSLQAGPSPRRPRAPRTSSRW